MREAAQSQESQRSYKRPIGIPHAEKTVMDLVFGCFKVERPQGKVRGGNMKDLLNLFENLGVSKQSLESQGV